MSIENSAQNPLQLAEIDVALDFSDVDLIPARSRFSCLDEPASNLVGSCLTPSIRLRRPFIFGSRISNFETAVDLARNGGLAILPGADRIRQVHEISKVKRANSFINYLPRTIRPENTFLKLSGLCKEVGESSFPVCDETGIFLGMISLRDFYSNDPDDIAIVSECMTPRIKCVTASPVIQREEAELIFRRNPHLKVLPLVRKDGTLAGTVRFSELLKTSADSDFLVDGSGRLRVGASVSAHNFHISDIQKMVVDASVDVIFVEEEHAFTEETLDVCRTIRELFPKHDPRFPALFVGKLYSSDAVESFLETYSGCIDGVVTGGSSDLTACGFGGGQLSNLLHIADYCRHQGLTTISEVDPAVPANMVKAIAAGADALLINSEANANTESISEWTESLKRGIFYGGGSMDALRRNASWNYKTRH